VFDKLTYAGNLANPAPVATSPGYRFVRGDICSAADLDAAMLGSDVVVNFAAESHGGPHSETRDPHAARHYHPSRNCDVS
jgi:dTDP-D-glucose 4,6-dehydratase